MDKKRLRIVTYAQIEETPRPALRGDPIDDYTWEQLAEKFPVLLEMQTYYKSPVPQVRDGELYFCANEPERRLVTKRILGKLMDGWTKIWPSDGSPAFWEAYDTLYRSQPDCVRCGCFSRAALRQAD